MSTSSSRLNLRDSLLVTLSFLALAAFGFRTISNADFWIHLATGRTLLQSGWIRTDPFSFVTAQDRVWVNPSWLYDALLHIVWQAGSAPLVILAGVALILGAFWMLRPIAVRGSGALPMAAALVMMGWLIAPAFVPAPYLLAAFCLSAFIRLLSAASLRTCLIVLVPLQIVWTNLHPSFLLGPLLALLFYSEGRRMGERRLAAWLPVALLLCTLVNPYGTAMHRGALDGVLNPESSALLEWISPMAGDFAPFAGRHINTLILVLIASGFVTITGRLPLAITTLGVAGAFLMVLSPRFHLFGALVMFPFLSCSIKGLGDWLRLRGVPSIAPMGRALLLGASILTLIAMLSGYYLNRTGSLSAVGLGIARDVFPEHACERVLGRPDFPSTVLNLAHDGGYLAWRLPGRKIFTDTRAAVYGAGFYQGFARGLLGQEQVWNNLIERFKPEALILNGSWMGAGQTTRRLLDGGQWALAYFDGLTTVLLRNTRENAPLLLDSSTQQAGIELLHESRGHYVDEMKGWLPVRNNARLIGAGQTFFALWRFREAQDYFALAARGSPTFGLAWQNLGISALQTGQTEPAILALDRATELRRDPALAWLWLAKAFEQVDEPRRARAAKHNAQKIDPALAASFEKSFEATNRPSVLMQ